MKSRHTLSKLSPDATLSQIITADQKAANLLASIGLDLSRFEHKTLREVCAQKQWSEEEVMEWIKSNQQQKDDEAKESPTGQETDLKNDLSKLCRYLEEEYHSRVYGLLSEVHDDFPRVYKIHGNQYSWLKDAAWHFKELHETLVMSFNFREKKFFPLIRQLHNKQAGVLDGTVRKLKRSVGLITKDQEKIVRHIKAIRTISERFDIPEGTCSTLRILVHNFKALFSGLEKQFDMEKRFLIPAVRQKVRMIQKG